MTEAHAQDFERKRRPTLEGHGRTEKSADNDLEGSSDEEEEEDEDEARNSEDVREAQTYLASARGDVEGER